MRLAAPRRFHAAYVPSRFAAKLLRVCQSVDSDVSQVFVID
jgi:hypothetical protein